MRSWSYLLRDMFVEHPLYDPLRANCTKKVRTWYDVGTLMVTTCPDSVSP